MKAYSKRIAALWTAIHACLWLALIGGLVGIAPRMEGLFADYGVDLPRPARVVIQVSHVVLRRTVLALGAVAVLLVVDFLVAARLCGIPELRRSAIVWNLAMILAPFVLLAWAVLAFLMVLTTITGKLSG